MKHTVRVSKADLVKKMDDYATYSMGFLPNFIELEAELVSEGCCDSCRNTHEFHKRSGFIPCICPCQHTEEVKTFEARYEIKDDKLDVIQELDEDFAPSHSVLRSKLNQVIRYVNHLTNPPQPL